MSGNRTIPRMCEQCGKRFMSRTDRDNRYCSRQCSHVASRGKKRRRRAGENGRLTVNANGYLVCQVDGKQVLYHRLVMAEQLGHDIPAGYDVHHIDENRRNNDPSNLALMTHGDHMRLHALARGLGKLRSARFSLPRVVR